MASDRFIASLITSRLENFGGICIKTTVLFGLLLSLWALPRIAGASSAIGTFNLRNFKEQGPNRREHLRLTAQMIKRSQASLLAIQEVLDEKTLYQLVRYHLPGWRYLLSECGGSGAQRLGFLYQTARVQLISSRESQVTNLKNHCWRGTRPLMMAKFSLEGYSQPLTLLAVHLKAGGDSADERQRRLQLSRLGEYVQDQRSFHRGRYMILGDFNTADYFEKSSVQGHFLSFLRREQLSAPTNELKCSAYWEGHGGGPLHQPSKLDHILISYQVLADQGRVQPHVKAHCDQQRCTATTPQQLGPSYREVSDHCPVTVDIK